jgi:hypothetical protein
LTNKTTQNREIASPEQEPEDKKLQDKIAKISEEIDRADIASHFRRTSEVAVEVLINRLARTEVTIEDLIDRLARIDELVLDNLSKKKASGS